MRFIDTNVLLYAISSDPEEREKSRRANQILAARDLAVSVQVLQEFYVQATRINRPDAITHEQAVDLVESYMRFPVAPITAGLMRAAFATSRQFRISYWDAAVLEAARAMGCDVVLSEDLSDGEDYTGVRAENPFGKTS
ncbi:hypothetical protein A9W99_07580 [Mycobacterium sp. 1164966.3]|uniref:PIN domain-containing protein n=1 Tax=Mycobacterium sp. 1164966.3 TaxID=1856861 RepID=UPI0007FE7BFC|nr:PIN domain-containing protein [Mycobacterium sp. 1164966.3]OBA83533.1 hypothetical protein A9W99_07580 [Mycobacterium sp. 1164966.3]